MSVFVLITRVFYVRWPWGEGDVAETTARKGDDGGASPFAMPQIGLPKGGGAIRGIGETFQAGSTTGTGSLSVPIATSPGRSGFGPSLAISYDSGSGNGPFGLGWSLALPNVTRRTDRGLPLYADGADFDIFIFSGAEDLVPALVEVAPGTWSPDTFASGGYVVTRYRPRIEGLFARIERWTRSGDGDTYWRAITRDNVTTFYGKDPSSRVVDPDDRTRVFTWLISESRDNRGNAIVYDYAAEDSSGVDGSLDAERNRTVTGRSANRYPKRVRYGNVPSLFDQPDLTRLAWRFEVVFDYGEGHYKEQPPDAQGRVFATASPNAPGPWPVRVDPFSTYRPGFEVRTYRLCQRALMFHHFPDELGRPATIVRATHFEHAPAPIATTLIAITRSGYAPQADGTSLVRSLPPLEFQYSQAQVNQDVREVDSDSLANLPSTAGSRRYRWVDLDGEGLKGVLTEDDGGWSYKRNLSALTFAAGSGAAPPTITARFDAVSEVATLPAFAEEGRPRHRFLDLAGDGRLDCVVLEPPMAGYYKRADVDIDGESGGWEPFRALDSMPVIDWSDPNLRFLDLDGDGFTDILVAGDEVMTWYPSLAEGGFGDASRVARIFDEERGPAVVFADPLQTIFLADMSGDGLVDVVRVRDGEVCYWPNLGYGRFGPKVAMDGAPEFEGPDLFDARRVRLADVDGSGPSDLVYLASDGVRLYSNRSGNSWSDPEPIATFPRVDDVAEVQVIDLLGNGTACLVWSSALPDEGRHAMRYVDLMGGQKPYLMVGTRNNLGAETRVTYAPSTTFALADRESGHPWATRLHFPVQVVERVETIDRISRNRFVTRYSYHHGYFDPIEREFRGFGRVEQRDCDEIGSLEAGGLLTAATNIDAVSYVPPVVTKTWYHTGAFPDGPALSQAFAAEYYRESAPAPVGAGLSASQAMAIRLPESTLPANLVGDEFHEAIRALKGAMIRQEVYADDGTEASGRPYRVTERNYNVRRVQPLGKARHAVFLTHVRESIDWHYERALFNVSGRTLADPRAAHSVVLDVNDFGDELLSVGVAYGRRHDDPDPILTADDRAAQKGMRITCTATSYTNAVLNAPDAYRAPMTAELQTYELIKVVPNGADPDLTNLFTFDELTAKVALAADGLHDLPYEDVTAIGATTNHPYRRPIEHNRILYRRDDLSAPLPLGLIESRALPYQGFKLALTPGLLTIFKRGAENLLPVPSAVLKEGGYAAGDDLAALGLFPATDAAGAWWIPTGTIFYSPLAADLPAVELANALSHFFLIRRHRDPFGQDSTVSYDPHDLLMLEVVDAIGNRVTAGNRAASGPVVNRNDYRVLQPALVTDANGNQTAVAFDALGLVAGIALMGKPGESLGDSLNPFNADLIQADIDIFFANPRGPQALALLGTATSRLIYDVRRYLRSAGLATLAPVYAATISRETHVSDLTPNIPTEVQVGFSYSDGFGREIQGKSEAEPGPIAPGGVVVEPRWVASGWTVFNNKGKPVRQFEPFFDASHDFVFGVAVGVSPVLFYDPMVRVVATLHPDHSWQKVVFNPWQSTNWDVNDTSAVLDPKADPDVGPYMARIPNTDYLPTWAGARSGGALGPEEQDAAAKTLAHANTPSTGYLDPLGRPFLTIALNRTGSGAAAVESHDRAATTLDIEGNPRALIDALGRVAFVNEYDMLGHRLHQRSIDAGDRWKLGDVADKPIRGWDSRFQNLRSTYDALRRPVSMFVAKGGAAPVQAERIVYGEGQPGDLALNLRGRAFQQFDEAGVVSNDRYDFKGNILSGTRRLRKKYAEPADWSKPPDLEIESFTSLTKFDAMNRPIQLVGPIGSKPGALFDVIQPLYNEAKLVAKVDAWFGQSSRPMGLLTPATASSRTVTAVEHNAKGQRTSIKYGNGSTTTSAYDPTTFRLTTVKTTRASDNATLQALTYHYDPSGNVTRSRDDAQQTVFFNNQLVAPVSLFTYDATYRLTAATGRELIGLTAQPQTTSDDSARMAQPLPGDAAAMRNYTETYGYDPVGNILALIHSTSGGNWTRTYAYDGPNPSPTNNRLTSTNVGAIREPISYDIHGNMTTMSHLSTIVWDYRDRLQSTKATIGAGSTTYYVYDSQGRRVRKVTENSAGVKTFDRLYIGGIYEVYREFAPGGSVTLERTTLHLLDGTRRVALVETTTIDTSVATPLPTSATRYQIDDRLGSASLELDEAAAVITYEEYYPFGSTSFQAGRTAIEARLKRYRFTGKERDEESGFSYHGARYYIPWLGRWTSCDPAGPVDGPNLYAYVKDNPVRLIDPGGTAGTDPDGVNRTPGRTSKTLVYNRKTGDTKLLSNPETTLADDPAFKDLAGKVESGMRSTNYKSFRATLNQGIKEILEGAADHPLKKLLEVKGNKLVWKAGTAFAGEELNYAHTLAQKSIANLGADEGAAVALENLSPVGRTYHLSTYGHAEDYATSFSKAATPEAAALEKALADELAVTRLARARSGQRGFATIGSMAFTLVSIGLAVYVVSQAKDKPQATLKLGVDIAVFGLVAKLAGGGPVGFIVAGTIGMYSDNAEMNRQHDEEEAKDSIAKDFIRKNIPNAIEEHWYGDDYNRTILEETKAFLFESVPIPLDEKK